MFSHSSLGFRIRILISFIGGWAVGFLSLALSIRFYGLWSLVSYINHSRNDTSFHGRNGTLNGEWVLLHFLHTSSSTVSPRLGGVQAMNSLERHMSSWHFCSWGHAGGIGLTCENVSCSTLALRDSD